VNKWICMSCRTNLVGNYSKLATDPVDQFPEPFLSNICANLLSASKFNVPVTKPLLLLPIVDSLIIAPLCSIDTQLSFKCNDKS